MNCAGLWFSSGSPFSSTNTTDCHENPDILLKVALNIINPKPFHDGECAVFFLPFIRIYYA